MKTIRERMSEFLEYQGISDYAFEKAAGLSKGYMNKCKNPSGEVIAKLCGLYTTLSAEWLIRGEGSMLRKQDIALMLDDAIKDSTFLDDRLDKVIEKKIEEKVNEYINKKSLQL